jgi:hypothetical protein
MGREIRPITRFNSIKPVDKEEKLIAELVKSLDKTTEDFMDLNYSGIMDNKFFGVLRDSSVGYTGKIIENLARCLANKENLEPFLKEVKDIFNCYIERIRSDFNEK